jgi:hypothetical protein
MPPGFDGATEGAGAEGRENEEEEDEDRLEEEDEEDDRPIDPASAGTKANREAATKRDERSLLAFISFP